jgi:hypothetical protein
MTTREKARRNEKMAALAMLCFVVAMVSAGAVEYAKELGWKPALAGAALLCRRSR